MTNFCVGCRHINPNAPIPAFASCLHPQATVRNDTYFVIGGEETVQQYCVTMRQHGCGPEGKYWEPRE